jgi:hypothetical protein
MYKNHINFCLSYLNKHTGLKYKLKHNLSCQTNISHLQFLNFIILKEIIPSINSHQLFQCLDQLSGLLQGEKLHKNLIFML